MIGDTKREISDLKEEFAGVYMESFQAKKDVEAVTDKLDKVMVSNHLLRDRCGERFDEAEAKIAAVGGAGMLMTKALEVLGKDFFDTKDQVGSNTECAECLCNRVTQIEAAMENLNNYGPMVGVGVSPDKTVPVPLLDLLNQLLNHLKLDPVIEPGQDAVPEHLTLQKQKPVRRTAKK